jgi:hypothetical protein
MAIHDVDMNGGSSAALSRGHLVCQVGEVGGEDGGKQLDHGVSGRRTLRKRNALTGQVYQ